MTKVNIGCSYVNSKGLHPPVILAYQSDMCPTTITVQQSKPYKPAYRAARVTGDDWRSIGADLIRILDLKNAPEHDFTCGFLFVTDALAKDAGSLLTLLQDVTGITLWTGCSGIGVLDGHGVSMDTPAASILLCNFPAHYVSALPIQQQSDYLALPDTLHSWLKLHGPPFGLVFADPFPEEGLTPLLQQLSRQTGAFLVGGVSSGSQSENGRGQLGGVLLSSHIYVQTAITQGCAPIGPAHTVTKVQNGMIATLDGQPALHVFASDLRQMVLDDIGHNPDDITVDENETQDALEESFRHLFQGEMHIGLSIPGSDRGDYLVRPMVGVEAETEHIMIGDTPQEGMAIRFVRRNDTTLFSDLSRMLNDIKKRSDTAPNAPKAALYITCATRTQTHDTRMDELVILRAALGDIPLAGFYAGGEIFREDAHSITGILTLFY